MFYDFNPKNVQRHPEPTQSTPKDVDQKSLFRVLLNRARIHIKMSKESDALSDVDRALTIASQLKDDYDMRTLKSSALLLQGYVYLTLKNKPTQAMMMLNESLILNPCANLNTETHSKLIYAISQSDYFDPEDWDEFTTSVVLRDFGDDGIRSCTSFMMTSPDQRKGKDLSVISDKDYVKNEVEKVIRSINIHWMLYNIYEASGKRKTAWSHLVHAHKIDYEKLGTLVDMSLQKISDDSRDIIDMYDDAEYWDERPRGSDSRLPVFIIGFFRSGSTLLENMLVQHPSIGTLGESSIFVEHLKSLNKVATTIRSSTEDNDDIQGDRYKQEEEKKTEESLLRNHSNSYLKSIITAIREDFPDKKVVRSIDKMLWNFRNLGVIQSMFPQSYIIHIIRDPLDTLVSCYKTQFKGTALEWSSSESSLVKVYYQYLRTMQHFLKILPGKSERIILITYESLVLDTKNTMKYVLDSLDLPWNKRVLKTSLRRTKMAYTASLMQVKHRVYNSSIGSWRGVPSHHVETIKRELQKYHKLLKTFKKIMSNNYIGKNYKQPNRFYRLNWALDPQFDYSYPSSPQKKEESNVDVPYISSISTMKEKEEEEEEEEDVNVHADPLDINNYDEL